jgi:hypothetical protein
VFGDESRDRLPELAVLAGNIVTYVAATTAGATSFWDRRCCLPCGRLRKKASVTTSLPKGAQGYRCQKGGITLSDNNLQQQKAV